MAESHAKFWYQSTGYTFNFKWPNVTYALSADIKTSQGAGRMLKGKNLPTHETAPLLLYNPIKLATYSLQFFLCHTFTVIIIELDMPYLRRKF